MAGMGSSLLIIYPIMISLVLSIYVIDNKQNIRIVSHNESCNHGRIEFFYGQTFGSFADCHHIFNIYYANAICNNLGFDKALNYSIGNNSFNMIHAPSISYTNIHCNNNNCNHNTWNMTQCNNNICSQCLFTKDINDDCPSYSIHNNYEDIHQDLDVYIECTNNNRTNKYSHTYECNYYDSHSNIYTFTNNLNYVNTIQYYNNMSYQSCNYRSSMDNNQDSKSRIAKILIAIFSIFVFTMCMYVYCTSRDPSKRKLRKTYVDDVDMKPIGVEHEHPGLQAGNTKAKDIVNDYERM